MSRSLTLRGPLHRKASGEKQTLGPVPIASMVQIESDADLASRARSLNNVAAWNRKGSNLRRLRYFEW